MYQLWPPGHYFVISEPMLRWKRRCLCNPLFQEMRLMKDAGLDTFFITKVDTVWTLFQLRGFTETMDDFVGNIQDDKGNPFHWKPTSVFFLFWKGPLCLEHHFLYLLWAVKVLVSACGLSILADGCFCGCGQYDPTASNCVGEWERWRTGVRFNDEEPN